MSFSDPKTGGVRPHCVDFSSEAAVFEHLINLENEVSEPSAQRYVAVYKKLVPIIRDTMERVAMAQGDREEASAIIYGTYSAFMSAGISMAVTLGGAQGHLLAVMALDQLKREIIQMAPSAVQGGIQ